MLICLTLLLPLVARPVGAQNNSQITVEVGQPNIWSLGQAHYLLSDMRQRSSDLGVKAPLSSDLDPTSANGARLNVLRTFFGASADFDGVVGAQNGLNRKKFDTQFSRFETAQAQIDSLLGPYTDAVSKVSNLNAQLAALPDTAENADKRKQLNAKIAERTAERDRFKAEIDELRKVEKPADVTFSPPTPTGAIPDGSTNKPPDDLKSVFDALAAHGSTPRLDASTALDNYIQMQYEVIAKQLTLLRDEVGPEERLVFLELPMSVYSVPKRDDEYVVRLEWQVSRFFGPNGGVADKYSKVESRDQDAGEQEASAQTGVDQEAEDQPRPITLELLNHPELVNDRNFRRYNLSLARDLQKMDWMTADPTKFRVIDIIPRQSALNVNDVHGTQSGFALTAKFLSVFGLGGEVGYQRQRALYEQFLQQEVYASGFGKGMNNFGWTFGPLPGTKRIAPGVRTTYSILAIPRDALAVELKVAAKVYKRDRPPTDVSVKSLPQVNIGQGPGTFQILVPNERTEGFWVDSVAYTSVEKGNPATVIIKGKYFSPLTGVLINGVPLKRAVSIAKNESKSTSLTNAMDAAGEYEYLNPQQLILSLKMDNKYVGTPLITLVTPEKTGPINFFKLDEINFHYQGRSLAEISDLEPMFTDSFEVATVEVIDDSDPQYVTVYLHGTGLRRNAQIFIGPRPLRNRVGGEEIEFISTGLYRLKFRRPLEGRSVAIRYHHTTRQVAQEKSVTFQQTIVPTYEIVRYEPAARRRLATTDLILTVSGQDSLPTVEIDRRDGELIGPLVALGNQRFRLQIATRRDPVPLSVTGVNGVTRIFDIGLPLVPAIDSVVNSATGKPEGDAAKPAVVTLRGKNFQHVTHAYFGGKEVTILQVDPQVMLISLPPGNEGAVQVLLETNVNLRGKVVSNIADFRTQGKAIYTYVKGD
jgi:hypothetical protein